ncbi:hypothetical protein F4804DRAFT_314720 [Jackrogersella minutella]|nr:hypothetical protein F4804DRAFT_314720 [Jackrogersella minutella]
MSQSITSKQDLSTPFGQQQLQRLLKDIRELVEKPYPNITLHTYDEDILTACLVLTPTNSKPLHLTVSFRSSYPIHPPLIKMDSNVIHPNVYNSFV